MAKTIEARNFADGRGSFGMPLLGLFPSALKDIYEYQMSLSEFFFLPVRFEVARHS